MLVFLRPDHGPLNTEPILFVQVLHFGSKKRRSSSEQPTYFQYLGMAPSKLSPHDIMPKFTILKSRGHGLDSYVLLSCHALTICTRRTRTMSTAPTCRARAGMTKHVFLGAGDP